MTGKPSPASRPEQLPRTGVGRSSGTLAAIVLGAPMAVGILVLFRMEMWDGTLMQRYVSHPIECVEIVLFCCAVGALASKYLGALRQKLANRRAPLPAWDGKPVPVEDAAGLLAGLSRLPRRARNTWAARRAAVVLDFLCRRRSAAELDDHIRGLADSDAEALENSYSFVRFLIWSLPILGFLGTVLGITGAVAGVTPEVLEKSISTVTGGLALAFDTTGLALILTMAVMFLTFVVERMERGALEEVDRLTDLHLSHRFARLGAETAPFLAAVEQQGRTVLGAVEQLVRRQADLWAKTLAETEARRAEAERQQQQRFTQSLETALERTLSEHGRRLEAMRQRTDEETLAVLEPLADLAHSLREQREGLLPLAEGMRGVGEALSRLHEGEGELLRLQKLLQQNLASLAAAGAFEEAVHSLTAAVHLLTARGAAGGLRLVGGETPQRPRGDAA